MAVGNRHRRLNRHPTPLDHQEFPKPSLIPCNLSERDQARGSGDGSLKRATTAGYRGDRRRHSGSGTARRAGIPSARSGQKNLMGVIVKVRFRRSEGMGSISAIARDLNRLRKIMPKSRKLPRSIFFLCPGRLFLTPDRAFILIFEEARDLAGFEGDFILFTPKELSPRFLFHPRG